jgi:hypothetical protein|tara:strand:- start:7290 stop:7439 length:150 start_codon:yes stop_codon:yes gene_type:complete
MNKHRHDWARRDKKEIILSLIAALVGAALIAALLVLAPTLDQLIIDLKG